MQDNWITGFRCCLLLWWRLWCAAIAFLHALPAALSFYKWHFELRMTRLSPTSIFPFPFLTLRPLLNPLTLLLLGLCFMCPSDDYVKWWLRVCQLKLWWLEVITITAWVFPTSYYSYIKKILLTCSDLKQCGQMMIIAALSHMLIASFNCALCSVSLPHWVEVRSGHLLFSFDWGTDPPVPLFKKSQTLLKNCRAWVPPLWADMTSSPRSCGLS